MLLLTSSLTCVRDTAAGLASATCVRVCVCVRGILYISAIQVCFPLANEVIVVFPCTICLTERLLPTFSYAIVLGTSSIFHKRKFSILESSTARKHSASKVLCNTDHLLTRLLDG